MSSGVISNETERGTEEEEEEQGGEGKENSSTILADIRISNSSNESNYIIRLISYRRMKRKKNSRRKNEHSV